MKAAAWFVLCLGFGQAAHASVQVPHLWLPEQVRLRFASYVDSGAFWATGDGVTYARDVGKKRHPTAAASWVFDGDPWANSINAQGDSADLGLDRTNLARFDAIHSHGKPTFIVNTANLTLLASVGDSLLMETSVNFYPRQGVLGAPGDGLDVDLAYLDWAPFVGWDVHLFAGKFESTFGIEYRRRKAPDMLGVTPSIMSRYTVGTPTGLKARGIFWDGLLSVNLALTNGSMAQERFGLLFNELSTTYAKTVSGRLASAPALPWVDGLEVGVSALYGPQDLQPRDAIALLQFGADAQLRVGDLELRGEYMQVHAPGGGVVQAPVLQSSGFYAEAYYQLLTVLGLHARVDRRDATLLELPNLYFSNVLRVTGGVRCDVTFNVLVKAEFTWIKSLTRDFSIPTQVATTALILKL